MEIIEENVENSDDENEMNTLSTAKLRKKPKILDSDSENENSEPPINEPNLPNEEESSQAKKHKRISVVDSDSDEEAAPHNTKAHSDVDEELEEEEEIAPHNKSFPDEETAVEAVIYTTNSKGELIQENNTSVTIKKASLSTLCDSESEDENEENIIQTTLLEEPEVQPMVYKRPRKKKNEDKPKPMTAQEAAKQRTEIQSDSQKRLRNSNVSLPYHKPKSYTIREFLEKRSKLPSAVPLIPKAPPPIAIKMSKDQLKEVSKKLDERIKEVEEFYKSESEDDAEDDPSEEIRGWLNILVDGAVNTVESRENDVSMEEPTEENEEKQHESMEYDFNLDDVNELEISKKPPITELIKDKLRIQPKLSGTPDDIIDLEAGVTTPSAVKQLVEKFLQHTTKKIPHKHKVELDIVEVGTSGQIVKETVSMNLDEEEEPAMFETPGAKLQKLREELQMQMAQKRLELWKQKHEQGDTLTTEKKSDSEETQGEKDILDDEDEEFEMTESESDEEDEEEEDLKPEKPKPKSAFVDEEADEDEETKEDYEEDVNEDEEEIIDGGGDFSELEDESGGFEGDIEEAPEEELKSPKKKILKRIVKAFTEDSDEEEETSLESEPTKVLKYYTTDEDDIIPPNLPRVGKTPQRTQPEKNKSEFDFLTPVSYLTGLQNLNSDSKFSKDSPKSPYVPSLSSEDMSSQSHVQKNLFPENSQSNVEDLVELCSGKFAETQVEKPEETGVEELEPTTQDLINVCSGGFSTLVSNEVSREASEKVVTNIQTDPENEIKTLDDEHDQIISQLLDEDELERFKKKFESPVNAVRKSQFFEDAEEVHATGLINSDDENEELEVTTKKKQKKLVFSDDEGEDASDDEEQEIEDEERIDLHDSDDEEQQLEKQILAEESRNYKYTDFLDKEAELSESEWGSADEDEKDLDQLEFEEGDAEKFNEKKMRTELERIHMRQILDEDNREVKLLQELLLEDGEMHGTGRKRQFRWSTLDSTDNGEFEKRDDDDIFLDEEENEEEWRKMRHKREMFLKKKSTTEDDDSILGDSQILRVGQQIFKNKSFGSQNSTPIDKTEDTNEPFSLLNKRGSFLSRNDQVLQRLAEYNKVTNSVGSTAAKNSKSFVFQTVGVNETAIIKDNNNKRKAPDGTPNVIKKLRLDDLSPAVNKKQTGKSSRAKKLFGNW